MTTFNKFQIILVTFLVGVSTFYSGYYVGKRGYLFELRKNPPKIEVINRYPQDQQVDFGLFWQVWDMVSVDYLERPVDPQKMLYGAISGMVGALDDPYTSFLTPELNETLNSSLNGSYEGIGAELGIRDNQLIIVAPLDGSPAQAAGAKAGDKILKIEDDSTVGVTLTEAVSKIRGPANTIISLTLQRDDGEPFVSRVKRGVISIESVSWKDKGNGNAYIRVSRFGSDTNKDWASVVSQVNSQMTELDAVIIDLRGNPGGYLQSAVYIAEEFMRGVSVAYQESATGAQVSLDAKRAGAFESIPEIIVLVDEGSASASEILAAALRDNKNATLVGQKTFGKGTVQEAKDFKDGSGVHITVAKWLTPKKVWVHGVGLTPDLEVERTAEDFNEGIDKQLDTALELADRF